MAGFITGRTRASFAVLGTIIALTTFTARTRAEEQPFIRGDVNQDGRVSLSDAITIRRAGYMSVTLPCLDAADTTDDEGAPNLVDEVVLAGSMFSFPQLTLPPPFTEAGPDPTPQSSDPRYPNPPVGCDRYQIQPAQQSSDTIRVGEVQAAAGQRIQIPIYLIASAPAAAIQLVLSYDSSLITIDPDPRRLDWSGTTFEPLLGKKLDKYDKNGDWIGSITFTAPNCLMTIDPGAGTFTIGIVSSFSVEGLGEIPSNSDVQFINVNATVSPGAPADAQIVIAPVNGEGNAGYGPYRLLNEISYPDGEARYLSVLPRAIPGKVGVAGDVSFFFKRGDANGDKLVDISDVVSVIDHLYLGGRLTGNPDAADADDNGHLEITDAVVIINDLFLGTPAIASPFPEEGVDPTSDSIH
jgi:hypothetical protein